MQILRTTRCSKYSHPEFVLWFDPMMGLAKDVECLVHYLEDEVASGKRFFAGQTIQIGWMLLSIKTGKNEELVLSEPDMKNIPVRFVESVTNTVTHLRLQKSVLESVGLEHVGNFPRLQESCIKCSNWEDSIDFLINRDDPTGLDSGWFFGCTDSQHDHNSVSNLIRVSLYDAVLYKQSVVSFLALPPTSGVVSKGQKIEVWYQQKLLRPKPGSLLDMNSAFTNKDCG